MLERVQSAAGNGYFSQAVAEFARNRKLNTEEEKDTGAKTIGEFSDKEWDKLLSKVDDAIDEYKEDLEERKEEALEKKQEQTENYILGNSEREEQKFEQCVMLDGSLRSMRFWKIESTSSEVQEESPKPDIQDTVTDFVTEEAINKLLGRDKKAPYSEMADENGRIEYNGIVFVCDYDNNRLCLGDVSNPQDCIFVPLENGGSLVFNRDCVDGIAKAIGMFSPEDVNRIMRAIAQDAKVKQTQMEMEDETSGVEVLREENSSSDLSETGEKIL